MRIKAEKLATITPNLSIRATKLANTVWEGIHNRNKAGMGENFWQFKKYEYGDPIHLVDWKKSAKSTDIFIQEQELSTMQNISIWKDTSQSMNYSSTKNLETKTYISNLITLTLAIIFIRNSEKVHLNGFNDKNMKDQQHIDVIANIINNEIPKEFKSQPNSEEIKNGSTAILIGDFLTNIENLEKNIKALSSRNINGLILHIVDPAEKNFPFSGRINFKGIEGEDPYLIGNADSIKKQYIDKFNNYSNKLKTVSEAYGWNYFMHITNQNLAELIMRIYSSLSENKYRKVEF